MKREVPGKQRQGAATDEEMETKTKSSVENTNSLILVLGDVLKGDTPRQREEMKKMKIEKKHKAGMSLPQNSNFPALRAPQNPCLVGNKNLFDQSSTKKKPICKRDRISGLTRLWEVV